jgi:hypothetical protein
LMLPSLVMWRKKTKIKWIFNKIIRLWGFN